MGHFFIINYTPGSFSGLIYIILLCLFIYLFRKSLFCIYLFWGGVNVEVRHS